MLASVYSLVCLGRRSGSEPAVAPIVPGMVYRGMCIVTIDHREACHLHHWILLLPVFFIPLPPAAHWFVVGMILQGLCYRDRFECIKDNPYTSRPSSGASTGAPCSEAVCRV